MDKTHGLHSCMWCMADGGVSYEGYHDGTTWNGWDNIYIHQSVLDQLRIDYSPLHMDCDDSLFADLPFDELTGTYHLNGYCTTIDVEASIKYS